VLARNVLDLAPASERHMDWGMRMARRNTDSTSATRNATAPAETQADEIEARVVAFAEQLGRMVGTVQAKASGWLDRDALTRQLSDVRDAATHLLDQLGVGSATPTAPASSRAGSAASGAARGRSGGVVDAPGKKHRKPTPNQKRATPPETGRIAKMKTVNAARRRGR